MSYHKFCRDGQEYGSFEVFHSDHCRLVDDDGRPMPPGWYWWAAFPGCLPDGDPNGPFDTEQAAVDGANE